MHRFLLLFILLTLILQAQEYPQKRVSLLLPWKHQFQFAGYYIAKELGYYKRVGIDLEIIEHDSSRDLTKDVINNRVEFGVGHSALLLEAENGIIFLTAIHQSSPLILLSKNRDDITSLKDITDKKIMLTEDQTQIASIYAMLHAEGIKDSTYKKIKTTYNPIDIVNGYADLMVAYTANEPFTLSEKDIKYTIFDPQDYGYDFYADILFTSQNLLTKDPKLVEDFRKATLQGWRYAYTHIDETIHIILKKYNTQNRTFKALRFEADTLKKLAFKKNINFGNINPDKLQEIATTYRLLGYKLPVKEVNYNKFIYDSSNDIQFFLKDQKDKSSFIYNFLHNEYFKKSLILLFIFLLFFLLFEYRIRKILKIKTTELLLKNKIFNKNICSLNVSKHGVINSVSSAYCKLCGYTKDELTNHTFQKVRDQETPKELYQDLWITISSGHSWSGEIKNIKKNGDPYWVEIIISPLVDTKGNILSYDAILVDISAQIMLHKFNEKLQEEVSKKTKELEKLANTDKLTGIYNRVKLDTTLEKSYSYFVEYQENFAIIIIDIDYFKRVNDTYGHQVGDEILIEITQIIQKSIRKSDILGRWGGEEFIIISAKTDAKSATIIAQNIRATVESFTFTRVGKLTISLGVADILSCSSIETTINQADSRLYEAKASGRNSVVGQYV